MDFSSDEEKEPKALGDSESEDESDDEWKPSAIDLGKNPWNHDPNPVNYTLDHEQNISNNKDNRPIIPANNDSPNAPHDFEIIRDASECDPDEFEFVSDAGDAKCPKTKIPKNVAGRREQAAERNTSKQRAIQHVEAYNNAGGNDKEEESDWSVVDDVGPCKVALLETFKRYSRRQIGKWEEQRTGGGTREKDQGHERVRRYAEAIHKGRSLQVCGCCRWVGYPEQCQKCDHCGKEGLMSPASAEEFLWSGMDGGPVVVPEFYGVPEDLHGEESLRWLGEVKPEQRDKTREYAFCGMKNLDRLMTLAYSESYEDENDKEYHDGDSRQYEEVNIFEGEEIDDLLAIDAKDNKAEFYSEPFEVVLDSGAGDHVASDADAPGYTVTESKGSRARQNFIAAGGHKIPNKGEMVLNLRSRGPDGREISTTFQVAKVTRPLWSVARICDAGFEVKFDSKGAKVLNKKGKCICTFERIGNLYKARLDLRNPSHESFGRRGQKR